jgi:hypothetical protein
MLNNQLRLGQTRDDGPVGALPFPIMATDFVSQNSSCLSRSETLIVRRVVKQSGTQECRGFCVAPAVSQKPSFLLHSREGCYGE